MLLITNLLSGVVYIWSGRHPTLATTVSMQLKEADIVHTVRALHATIIIYERAYQGPQMSLFDLNHYLICAQTLGPSHAPDS